MVNIYPGDNLPAQQVAQVLLDIVGPGRRHEVSTGTAPTRFEVPDDVAVEYERRLREGRNTASAPAAEEPAPEKPVTVEPTALRRVVKAPTTERGVKK